MTIETPWSKRTPQDEGRRIEKETLRTRGARPHPGSGSGSIRFDGSSEAELIEVKSAHRTHTISADYLESLHAQAVRQGKVPVLVLSFKNGVEVTMTINKNRRTS